MAANMALHASSVRAGSRFLPLGIGAVVLFSIAAAIGLITFFADQRLATPDKSKSGGTFSTSKAVQGVTDKKLRTRASWYGPGFQGHKTSTGEAFDQN